MPDEQHMKAALQAYLDGFAAKDADAVVALFAENAVVEDPVGSEPIRGRAALAKFYGRAVQMVSQLRLAAPIRGSHGNAAAMAFDVEMLIDGREAKVQTIDVMEFDADGKIASMRAYWGPSNASGFA